MNMRPNTYRSVVAVLLAVIVSGSTAPLKAQGPEGIGLVLATPAAIKAVVDILKEINSARSVVIEVDNNTNFTFRRVSDHHSSGGWAKTPRNDIPAKYSDVFGSRSKGGSVATGTVGEVSYTNGKGLKFTIKWANPFVGNNHCDVSVSGPQSDLYRVKPTCGAGNKEAHMRYEIYRSDWKRLPGCARDIGVDATGVAWAIWCTSGPDSGPGNFSIRRWNGEGWEPISGGGIRIAVEPGGTPWLVNAEGKIYRRLGTDWEKKGGPDSCAKDIGIDQSGAAWIIGCTAGKGPRNFTLRRWTGSGWEKIGGGGWRIAVEPGGTPWLVNAEGKIYRRLGTDWGDPLGGPNSCAKDIGVASGNRAWVVGCSKVGIGFSIHRWDEKTKGWHWLDGSAITIAVEPNGRPWVINASREIYVRDKKDY